MVISNRSYPGLQLKEQQGKKKYKCTIQGEKDARKFEVGSKACLEKGEKFSKRPDENEIKRAVSWGKTLPS